MPPPKNILNRSSGLISPSKLCANGEPAKPDEAREKDGCPLKRDSGSDPCWSYAALFCGSARVHDQYLERRGCQMGVNDSPDRTWNALETTKDSIKL